MNGGPLSLDIILFCIEDQQYEIVITNLQILHKIYLETFCYLMKI